MTKYTEIFLLKKMLECAGIPFEFYDRSDSNYEGYQIIYKHRTEGCASSVFQSDFSYGGSAGFLELMGRLQDQGDSVVGALTAKEAFRIINKDWENDKL
mgnify:FL=1